MPDMNGGNQHKGKRLIGNRNDRARSERSAAVVGRGYRHLRCPSDFVRIDRTDSGLDSRRLSIQWILSTREEEIIVAVTTTLDSYRMWIKLDGANVSVWPASLTVPSLLPPYVVRFAHDGQTSFARS